ncbi:MAG TPA: NADH-quinone oxidoreductase subunit C [bacterium]|nr:NADH-quinone oxidoreductase subunit C [bacterium]HPP29294.1 NADH-quinone oxidoreductase subunit C [bacterium]
MRDTTVLLKEKLGDKVKEVKVHNNRRIYITVDRKDIKECARIIFKDLDARYIIATGIENFDNFEILYHFGLDKDGVIVALRVYLDKEKPEVESLVDIVPGISYIEREMWELLGINFTGHPDMKHFLLRDDWGKGNYPLRKGNNGE